ncbi:11709_t:CDS:2 [Acaulospora morrowiae]|uniref:11709_t:CDS:1 n=1 Tax=Acaulospora morrowiae TaxID=94023 RepID=A0A9N8VBK5_9GLOM|nr:11709_t:CDS:2 [Acaulospora morrowiae]
MSESLADNCSANKSDTENGAVVGDGFFKGQITTDIVRLDKHFRRIWRSKLSLDSYPLDLKQLCEELHEEFRNDNSLKDYEKEYLEKKLLEYQDKFNLENQTGVKRLCKDCKNLTYATRFCEYCIRNKLKQNFDKWDSGDNKINKIIQEVQKNVVCPYQIVEWIPYENFDNIKLFSNGGFATVFTATWKNGYFNEWNSITKSLERRGEPQQIVLKQLNSSTDDSWLNEVTSHFSIDKIAQYILPCYGITRNPETKEFMLVLNIMEQNLQDYLIYNQNIGWEQKFDIIYEITASGMRPDINMGIPEKYKTLMQQCWDADPAKRPDTLKIWQREILNISKEPIFLSEDQKLQSRMSTSCILAPFKNSPKPINISPEISNKLYLNLRKTQF